MATISAIEPPKDKKFEFSTEFNVKFDSAIDRYTKSFSALTSVLHNQGKLGVVDEYGMYQSCYSMRYITPTQVSEYVDFLAKAINRNMLNPNYADLEKFTIAFVKRAFEESQCTPLDLTDPCGNYIDADAQGLSLQSLYLILSNDVHQPIVCSSYETKERRKVLLEGDYKNIQSLNFTSAMKAIVAKVGDIVNEHAGYPIMQYMQRKMFSMYLEKFILFAIEVNNICLKGMFDYVYASASYNVSEMEELVSESVDMKNHEMMFVIFTEGQGLIVSNTIRKITNCKFSHASISLSADMHHVHSFDGAVNGYSLEDMNQKKYENTPFTVYGAWVSKDAMERMKKKVADVRNGNNKYDWEYCVKTLFGINSKHPSENDYKYVCSSFVNAVMKAGGVPALKDSDIESKTGIATPAELYNKIKDDNHFVCVYSGLGMNYDEAEAVKRMKLAAQEKEFKTFDGVYTECAMIKDGEFHHARRIPFNCNMRDIVLQDMHPYFKDTWSAIEFILTDSRSPISVLVNKHMSDDLPFESLVDIEMISKMFVNVRPWGKADRTVDGYDEDYYRNYHRVDFHTDVNWLDKIAYGNNSLNSNYRVDAMGNNKFNPIVMTLDNLWRMFNTEDAKSNNELADALVKVAFTIKAIIMTYRQGKIDDWYLTKDILALLGEIFTRTMLKLYYNNYKVYTPCDASRDTMAPGYMYTECYLMEAEGDDAKKAGGEKGPSVEIQNTEGKTVSTNVGTKLKNLLAKFVAWIQDVLSKFPGKFNENHKMEIKWVQDHDALNKEIEAALGKTFNAKLNNFTLYKIPVNDWKFDENPITVDNDASENKTEGDPVLRFIPGDEEFKKYFSSLKGEDRSKAFSNFALHGIKNANDKPQVVNGNLTPEIWNDIIKNIVEAPKAIEAIAKKNADFYKKKSDEIAAKYKDDLSDAQKQFLDTQTQGMQNGSKFTTAALNELQKTFYRSQYEIYRQIVNGYQQQKGKGGETAPSEKEDHSQESGEKSVGENQENDS